MRNDRNNLSDADLLRHFVASNDLAAMEELFNRHAEFAYRIAFRVVRNAADAEDAVQTAFAVILRKAATCRTEHVKGWIAQTVVTTGKNLIRSAVRRRGREAIASEDYEEISQENSGNKEDRLLAVKRMLDTLPERCRTSIWLHHYEGWPFERIAEALSMPASTARSHANRGLAMLREKLARAGMPVSSVSVMASIGNLAGEQAPATLQQSIAPLVASQGAEGLSPMAERLVARALRPASAWLKPAVAAATVAVAAGTAGILAFLPEREPSAKAANESGIHYEWDFNTPAIPEILRPIAGQWRHLPDGGPDGSGCMEIMNTEDNGDIFRLLIDLPMQKLPVLATWQEASFNTSIGGETALAWETADYFVRFHRLGDRPFLTMPSSAGKRPHPSAIVGWRTVRAWITRDHIATEVDSDPPDLIRLLINPRRNNARLLWFAQGHWRMDNFSLRSVSPEEVPDFSPYLEAARNVPPEKRDGRFVSLPGLKVGRAWRPIPHVQAVFHSADCRRSVIGGGPSRCDCTMEKPRPDTGN